MNKDQRTLERRLEVHALLARIGIDRLMSDPAISEQLPDDLWPTLLTAAGPLGLQQVQGKEMPDWYNALHKDIDAAIDKAMKAK
ncbi:hypothetical protein [Antrihabitans stalactiti]|uniref:Uncharacterized protein n=1 Tax=Antrihabitans stalactiti TaxID=2584121 RepID=A0A848KA40_9NOCA|nr:hypothetical protein [Antrihabitans stalactiti]NMN94516.1 hypothetical protein [Antrihabitans stalactiti]